MRLRMLLVLLLASLVKTRLNNSGAFNGIRTHDLCDAGAMLYQLSFEMCGFIAKLVEPIAEVMRSNPFGATKIFRCLFETIA